MNRRFKLLAATLGAAAIMALGFTGVALAAAPEATGDAADTSGEVASYVEPGLCAGSGEMHQWGEPGLCAGSGEMHQWGEPGLCAGPGEMHQWGEPGLGTGPGEMHQWGRDQG